MLKKRLIPVLFLRNGLLVRSEQFKDWRELGNPIHQLERLNDWDSDELIYIDITRDGNYDSKRDDHRIKNFSSIMEILRNVAPRCFMPLTFGGRIRDISQVDDFIANGADKVVINSGAYWHPDLLSRVVNKYGSQCLVVGIDVLEGGRQFKVYVDNGRTLIKENLVDYAKKVESLGAGEIFLNSIDRDGSAGGYNIDLINQVADAVAIPVIACGGAGNFDDFAEVMNKTNAAAVAAGNIFNFKEDSYVQAKKFLRQANLPVR